MTKIDSTVGNKTRYIVLLLNKNSEHNGTTKYMKECEWVSLQTRSLKENYNLKPYKYIPIKKPPLNQKINLTSQDEKQTIYNCDTFPINITLLNMKDTIYSHSGTIVNALETFQTIINFK